MKQLAHRTPHRLLLFLLSLASLSAATAARDWFLDECTSDPKVAVTTDSTCTPARALLISVDRLHGNPYHALQDVAWAASHYLSRCLPSPRPHHSIYLYLNVSTLYNPALCSQEPPYLNRTVQPSWGMCALRAAAFAAGIPPQNMLQGVTPLTSATPCFRATVHFRATFRELRWKTRRLSTSTLLPRGPRRLLKKTAAAAAIRHLSASVFSLYGAPRHVRTAQVHVLLYDRHDVRRRRWANADLAEERLRGDTRVLVRRVSTMPYALARQAPLFRWADVLITPHGAAMANTVFQLPGTDIIEVWKCCRQAVSEDPELPRKWTGWHAATLDLGLRYVQCHPMDGPFLSARELGNETHVSAEDQWCSLREFRVRMEELQDALDVVIPRQVRRVRELRRAGFVADAVLYGTMLLVALVIARCLMSRAGRMVFGAK